MLISLLLSSVIYAQNLDKHSQKALEQTKEVLVDPVKRQSAINENQAAKDAASKVDTLTMGNATKKDEVFNLSADILENISKASGGDSVKMKAIVRDLQKNPAALKKYLSKEQLKHLQSLGKDLSPKQSNP